MKILLNLSPTFVFLILISFSSCSSDSSHFGECIDEKLDNEFFKLTSDLADYLIKNKIISEYTISEMHVFLINNDSLQIEEYRIINNYEKQLPNLGQLYAIMGCCSYLIENEHKIPRKYRLLCGRYLKSFDGQIDFVDLIGLIKDKYVNDKQVTATMLIHFFYYVAFEGYEKFGDLRGTKEYSD